MKNITGNTLINLGYKPAKWFKKALTFLKDKELNPQELKDYLESVVPKEPLKLPLHEQPVSYFKNIKAYTEEESSNVQAVFKSMDTLLRTPTAVKGAVMPDACPVGEEGVIPVGGVAVMENAIHPGMHSADICCSVMATNFGKIDPKLVLDAANSITHFGPGGRQGFTELPEELEENIKNNIFLKGEKSLFLAKTHLGTQGDGNHFLFVGVSEKTGETFMVTHHGSRGFGANLYKQGMLIAEKFRRKISPDTLKKNAWIPYDTPEGESYWEALQVVREWTKLNHTLIHTKTEKLLPTGSTEMFWNEHNFVFKKGNLFFHAKGATPLTKDFVPDSTTGLRLIPLNMAEPVLIVKGESSESNLGFAPHGAGRNVSRSAHKRKKEGIPKEVVLKEETKGLDIRFYSGKPDLSELPSAYKNARAVQDQIEEFGLGEVVDKIYPYGCIMAGERG